MRIRAHKRPVNEFAIGYDEGADHGAPQSRSEIEASIEFFEGKRDECRRMMFDSGIQAAEGVIAGLRSRLRQLEEEEAREVAGEPPHKNAALVSGDWQLPPAGFGLPAGWAIHHPDAHHETPPHEERCEAAALVRPQLIVRCTLARGHDKVHVVFA